jgi:hypothetical protein
MIPRSVEDGAEDAEQRQARLDQVAAAIDSAARTRHERALLLSVAWHESRFASSVQACRTTGDKGRAVGLWQSWALQCPVSVEQQAREAARHLRSAERYCRRRMAGKWSDERAVSAAVSLYATGKHCVWAGARKRLETYRKFMAALR